MLDNKVSDITDARCNHEDDQKCLLAITLSTRYSCPNLMKLEFSRQIFENTQKPNFMKIRPVGTELFHADGWTDMTKLTVAFRNFASIYKSPYYIPRL